MSAAQAAPFFDFSTSMKPSSGLRAFRIGSGIRPTQLSRRAARYADFLDARLFNRGIPGGVGCVGAQHRCSISMRSRPVSARATGESGNALPSGSLSIIGRTKAGATALRNGEAITAAGIQFIAGTVPHARVIDEPGPGGRQPLPHIGVLALAPCACRRR